MRPSILLLALALGGCAGLHPYNEQRVGYAISAQTAFQKADFDAFMKTRRANLNALHSRDLQLAELRARAERDQAILAVFTAGTDWTQLDKGIAEQDEALGVDTTPLAAPPNCVASWSTTVAGQNRILAFCLLAIENARDQHSADLAASGDGFRLEWRLDPPACGASAPLPIDWTTTTPPTTLPKRYAVKLRDLAPLALLTRRLTYQDFLGKCRAALADETTETALMDALAATARTDSLPDLHARLMETKNLYDSQVAEAQAATDALESASEALNKASQAAPTISGEVKKAELDVASALKALENAGKATGIGQSQAAQAKLAAVDAFIESLSQSPPDAKTAAQPSTTLTPDLERAAAVLKTIPSLADQVVVVDSTLRTPRLSALQMEKTRQAALAAQAIRTRARAQQRVAVLQAAYDDRIEALRQLNNARLARRSAVAAAQSKNNAKTGRDSYDQNIQALDYYQIAVSLNSRSTALLEADQLDLEEQASADTAQFAIDSYRAALTTPLGQFVAYEDAGVKPADLAHALSSIATAVGANIIAGK